MLVKFKDGFSSPSHIHNVTYRGVVINGSVHNDDQGAAKMWMPVGSYWTQPAGENHITSAKGADSTILLEIEQGPYLVKPASEHFDNGERPLNLHVDNIVWQAKSNTTDIAYLWGSTVPNQLGATLIKLPANFSGKLTSNGSEFKVIIISGTIVYESSKGQKRILSSGSYISSEAEFSFELQAKESTLIYIRSDNRYILQER